MTLAISAPHARLPVAVGTARPGIAIIGGGASGTILAAHLLARGDAAPPVTMVEPHARLGCGLAYATARPEHLLNTRIAQMSAFADDPWHFQRWLERRAPGEPVDPGGFVTRGLYGVYLEDLLAPWRDRPDRLACVRDAAVGLGPGPAGVSVTLASGGTLTAGQVVLATGHAPPPADPVLEDAWQDGPPPDPSARVVILGTGLSMVDRVLSLMADGHRGEIIAVSRRGLLPRTHAASRPMPLDPAAVPKGAGVAGLLRWIRALAERAEEEGGTWRDAMDAVRPQAQAIWQGLDRVERARFLRHAVGWWDVHRHRMPPASARTLKLAAELELVQLLRAGFLGAARRDDGRLVVELAPRAAGVSRILVCDRIFDCRGIRRDPGEGAPPLMADLLARGLARIDPLRLGPEVDSACRLIGRDGLPQPRIFGLGPVTRARFWEITAIPDIRDQAARLAATLGPAPDRPALPRG